MTSAFMTFLVIHGCGLKPLLPTGPVIQGAALLSYEDPVPSQAAYTGEARVAFPILPLQVFGLQYAVDVVYVSQNPDWDMHEYARLDVGGESIWIAKDSDEQGRQTIVSDRPKLHEWMPEIPAPRIEGPVRVIDRTVGRAVDVELSYTNPKGEQVDVTARGRLPKNPPTKRNGSTMGHSRDVVAAVLDIERFGSRIKGDMAFDGKSARFEKILGLVPFRFLLKQTQAGVTVTNFRQTGSTDGFTLTRPSPADAEWPTSATEQWTWMGNKAEHDNGINRFAYHLVAGGVGHISVQQHGLSEPTLQLIFQPALPDLRRPFQGVVQSQFVMHVNGEHGHGVGTISAEWTDEQAVLLTFTPTEPWWLADRPMKSHIRFNSDQSVDVRTVRAP